MTLDPRQQEQRLKDGMLTSETLECEECGQPILPGDSVLCADGYNRIYGEYVLSVKDPLHEENTPVAHARCVDGMVATPDGNDGNNG